MGQIRESRIAEAARLLSEQPLAAEVLPTYFRAVGEDDIAGRPPRRLAETVTRHLEAGRVRVEGEPAISVDPAGVIDIVTDDMPFLVDSVTGHLVRAGHDIALIVHPQLRALRASDGSLESFGPDGLDESWIHIEVEPLSDAECERMPSALASVLEDVRLAVLDWPDMRGRAAALAFALTAHAPAGVPQEEVVDATELLHWMADDHFTFVGYREYTLGEVDGDVVLQAQPGTALGVMRKDPTTSTSWAKLSPEARTIALEPHLLVLTKANRRSTVHRPVYLDYVGVKKFDAQGRVVGEHRFVGLYGATAYTQSVLEVPVVARKVREVLARAEVRPDSHDGRDLLQILESYPRDELFEIHPDRLFEIATEVLQLQERRQTRLLTRYDDFGRFVSALVYLPRDRYTTGVREHMQELLREAYDAESVDFTARVTESVLARLHFLVRIPWGQALPVVDEERLELMLAEATESWQDRFDQALLEQLPARDAAELREQFDDAFTEAYKEDFTPRAAVADAVRLQQLDDDGGMSVQLYDVVGQAAPLRRFKVFRAGLAMSLSEMLPLLQDLGVGVVDERPYSVVHAGRQAWIYDFGLTLPARADAELPDRPTLAERFQEAFLASWQGRLDRGGFGALVVGAGLTWRQVALVQTLMAYARQLGSPFSQRYSEEVLVAHGSLVRSIIELFEARLGPDRPSEGWVDTRLAEVRAQLDAIASLDEDRIVRSLLTIVLSVVRTNYFQRRPDGSVPEVISVKVLPALIPEAPRPRPEFEIWVHSPRVSGVHLRFGRVARGGLRWSDRRDDFRTEVLGLVKAQMVKNAVIVPVGAKGGFVCASLPDPSDREAWLAEGIACYRLFVSALLDITDNLVDGAIVPPSGVVRLDGDDPYLVVAADKGTATFSDIANELALERGFWLGDAFASGGSAGYDHKAMGITARGAWESVRRHFRSFGVDVQTEPFTVVGIGDMSGDVFGNGMLLSEQIRLVAAFDHRHIFLDPSPDPAASFAERARLFALPRSSWADYDPALISAGGGVHARTAKSIPITPEVREVIGLPDDVFELAPNDLLRAVLQARVDLLWNGGIGTYVKSSAETNLDVGDKANDAIRVNGHQLRCRVVGEGGNLGLTQRGRVEAAQGGVLLNTDAIDNSAGVDTSDHEVNIKILVDAAVREGRLPLDERGPLLESMTDEIAALVLRDNYEQNLLLSTDLVEAVHRLPVHRRLIDDLERSHELDRALEALPTDAELERRALVGEGLVCPELAVLGAHVKITLTDGLQPAQMSTEPWFARLLADYFPREIVERFDRLGDHPLANEIVTMMMANAMVNRGGITYPFRVVEETGAAPVEVARAYLVATEVFGLAGLWARIEALDDVAPMAAQTMLLREARRLLDRATRWTLQTRGHRVDVDAEVAILRPVVAELMPLVPGLLRGAEAERLAEATQRYVAAGAPDDLAAEVASLLFAFSLLDVVEVSRRTGGDPLRVADLYFATSERFGGDLLLRRITALPRPDRWATLARAALRSDLYTALAALTARIERATPEQLDSSARIDQWEAQQSEGISRARGTVEEITALDSSDIATLSVALRALRALVAQGGGPGSADAATAPSG